MRVYLEYNYAGLEQKITIGIAGIIWIQHELCQTLQLLSDPFLSELHKRANVRTSQIISQASCSSKGFHKVLIPSSRSLR